MGAPAPAPVQQHPGPCTRLLRTSLTGLARVNHPQTCPSLTGRFYFCFSSFFITQDRTFLEEEGKKSHEHLAQHCHNGLHYDPLKPRINFECSSVSFISLPSVSPWFASPEMGRESGMQTLFFLLQLLGSLSACPPGRRWSVSHTVTKPARPHGNKIIKRQAGSTEGFPQPKTPGTPSSLDGAGDEHASEALQCSFYFVTTLFSCPFENRYINPQILDIELSRC